MHDESLTPAPLKGAAYIREFASRLSASPGVYRMIGEAGQMLYVGKAKNLKKRVTTYGTKGALPTRILRMIAQTVQMEVIATRSEAEALLLEASLIKQLTPIYNVLLKDDKSYPYIVMTGDTDFPQIAKHRGAQKRQDRYYGPFASVGAVNETLAILQRAFLLRPCPDTVFAHRSRPCLQYQIKRCSAPCVGRITKEDYAVLTCQAELFLRGKSREVQDEMTRQMLAHSERHEYEQAAQCRDRIRALTQVQQEQALATQGLADVDVVALHREGGACCIQIFFFRGGQNFGNRAFYPQAHAEQENAEILESFLGQFYQAHPAPPDILLSETPENLGVLSEALSLKEGRKVQVSIPQRGGRKQAVEQALVNARHALGMYLAERRSEEKHLAELAALCDLPESPKRIEVYDNSHIMGTHAIGAMVVATAEGFDKKSYRRFSIRREELPLTEAVVQLREQLLPEQSDRKQSAERPEINPLTGVVVRSAERPDINADDYAMLREVLTRRLSRLQKDDPARSSADWPELLLIDGGKGHLSATLQVLEELGVNDIPVLCIAKGVDRNAGRETFFMQGKEPFQLPPHTPLLHYLQRLRDEAHRFAITSHRIKRANALRASELDAISGIGGARKKALLHHFGSAKAVEAATLEELLKIPGINKKVAQTIYDHFHGA